MNFHPVAEIFPLMEGAEFDELVRDISDNGLREKIWLHPDGSIIDGRNRFRACRVAKVDPAYRTWSGVGSLISFVVSLNLKRRHLTSSQRAVLALKLEPMYAKEAKIRQQEHGRTAPGRGKTLGQKVDEVSKAAEKAAETTKTNRQYVADAKKLQSEAPDLLAEVEQGHITIPQAKQKQKQRKKAEVAEKIRSEPVPVPVGPFRVIVCDPPWKYRNRSEDTTHRARNPYPDLELSAIKELPVKSLAHEDCIIWLWTTNAFMRDAFECLDAWGFEFKTILTWVKDRMGLGDWLRGQTEHCLMGVRGYPTVTLTNQTTALCAPMREHSRKPDEFYAMVDALCPGSKLEMFARAAREGWQSWGAEKQMF